MKAVIAGAGRLGTELAAVLAAAGNEVTLIDLDEERLADAANHVPARMVTGDACEPYLLEEAGARAADLLVATTWDDEDNLVISLLAKRQFGIGRVVARVNDPDNAWLFDQRWGVDAAIPSATPLISLIQEATGTADTVTLLRLARAGVNLIASVIGRGSRSAGRPVGEIQLPERCVVAAVVRDGDPSVPDPSFRLRAGDEVLIVAQAASEPDVHAAFQ
jgi:trk system potassium uptake protein TrkA